ncbi:hypothetical protein FEM48_Zijuj10G0039000 [Ziziphus jujuba var. spinosa]|uniref:HORMA domain-containing protein n=1 Tax=Ziziphus jujuba var. spinosa TaxID=714518 RepID=A0A978UL51_ZIZJJ|nr:hypothetical protein FEM48_Zijuj10G0039000 [Ziziphus jujuba var. spinosa]
MNNIYIYIYVCSILYNRGVYPEESFVKVKKYGLPMLLTQDEGVKSFLANLNAQLSEWLEAGKLQRVVLVIMSKATNEVLERWNFSIETDGEVVEKGASREKSDKEIMREIQAIMRQIASSITYLPCLDESCVFDVLAYTDKDVAVPFTWIESDPKLIANPQMIHKVDTLGSNGAPPQRVLAASGVVKVNVDGAASQSAAIFGIGVVIRNSNGEFMAAMAKPLLDIQSPYY